MRKINITISIEDNDLMEYNLEKELRALLGVSLIDYRVFPNIEHLKENESYKKLVQAKIKAGRTLDDYINNNRK